MQVPRELLKLASLGRFPHCQGASYYTETIKEKLRTLAITTSHKCIHIPSVKFLKKVITFT